MTTTDSRETIFWGAYSFSTLRTICSRYGRCRGLCGLNAFPALADAIALLSALPSLPLAPVAGSMADRFHRHHILFNYTDNRLCHRGTYSVPVFFRLPQSVQLSCAGIDFRHCDFY